MPCLVVLLALIAPRVVSVVLWLFTTFFAKAYANNPLILLVGVIFVPFTTLAYAWRVNSEGGVQSAFSVVVMVLAVIGDLSSLAGGRRARRG
jgi:hypothetical protein